MDASQTWNEMLTAYATKQWADAVEYAEALRDWLEGGGFAPQPTIGTTTGNFTCQLDDEFSRAVCLAACHHVFERSILEIGDDA